MSLLNQDKMRVGLFCGSFNPIHRGHTQLAEWILSHTELDEIWLIVSPNNPLKQANALMDERLRYQMAEIACQSACEHIEKTGKAIRPCDIEFSMPKPNYTYLTLQRLGEAYPMHQFTLIIGEDNLAIFDRWSHYEWILANYDLLVYPRPDQSGIEADKLPAFTRGAKDIQVLHGVPTFPISATALREAVSSGEAEILHQWLEPSVLTLLQQAISTK